MSCLCPSCTPNPAPTYTENFRLVSEAHTILSWPFSERRAFLERVGKERGKADRASLEAELIRQHRESA